ncbi:MAG TPA: hypothetical protein DHV57_15765 [Hyphomonas sp.]|uniref:copper-binding protein n=1 Tax=uncultured Hyphomonas sp. TaxID=225298 RepID=UPI000C68B34A|nr:hypothetical protein [Hyphomonas sp.]MAN91700.1 hypothetical protein [Hyphomonadaceae bacterium]HBL93714.1 hypothetical protein [Hyphomonas sp.]HCJ18866.1 hypothetical protein [Hyphomonas sp.]|tara:strand:+ start:29449 stop:29868 length:420 start_codon:yes stop_codon:yes gene_type:complete
MTFKHILTASAAAIFLIGVAACTAAPATNGKTATANQTAQTMPHMARAYGSVLRRDLDARILEITHTPVPKVDWPIMQMEFYVSKEVELTDFSPGDAVEFVFNYAMDQTPVIIAMRRTTAQELIGAMWPEARSGATDNE